MMQCVQGAVYATDNTTYSWSAVGQEVDDATLNKTLAFSVGFTS